MKSGTGAVIHLKNNNLRGLNVEIIKVAAVYYSHSLAKEKSQVIYFVLSDLMKLRCMNRLMFTGIPHPQLFSSHFSATVISQMMLGSLSSKLSSPLCHLHANVQERKKGICMFFHLIWHLYI